MTLSFSESRVLQTSSGPAVLQVEEFLESGTTSELQAIGYSVSRPEVDKKLDKAVPVEVDSERERVIFNPDAMETSRPYVFRFLDHWMLARRSAEGEIDFFYFSSDSSEESGG